MTTQTLTGAIAPSNTSIGSSSKYKGLIIAISLFLLFNLLVLGLNFYTSQGLDNDAVSINLAGRQRMLSQRMTKVILGMQYDAAQGKFDDKNTAELKKVVDLFDATLNAFKNGGTATGGNEKPVQLNAVALASEQKLVDEALTIWKPYKDLTQPLINQAVPDASDLDTATNYARANNLKLLKLMNDLTSSLESNTKQKASKLQLIQTVALILSLILFANIVFNALRKLRVADAEITKAQRETTEILATVKEGLFLLNPEMLIGQQHSRSLSAILQRDIAANTPFLPLLQNMVSADTYHSAKDYIGLLFGNRVKESLVASLNPLTEVEVQDSNGKRYLNFQFNRVMQDKDVLHLLVTVQDITKQTLQAQELGELKGQSNINLSMLTGLMGADQYQLKRFLASAEDSFVQINQTMSEFGKNAAQSVERINKCFRLIHSVKGEAAALNLQSVQTHAHLFEEQLVGLKNKEQWVNEDYLKLPVLLNSLFDDIQQINSILDSIGRYLGGSSSASKQVSSSISNNLSSLVNQVSNNQQKEVLLKCDLGLLDELDEETAAQIQQMSIQLIRNGICHGIESPEQRAQKGKSPQGIINVSASVGKDGAIEVAIRDDGCGIVPERIRVAMMRSGRYSVEEVAALSDKQIVNKLFEPGFSTATDVSADAGHGVGMDMVQMKVQEMGGTLNISTKPDIYTQFTLRIPFNQAAQNQIIGEKA
jgi:two-component system, chemotaxis family, sensor kinase CheA